MLIVWIVNVVVNKLIGLKNNWISYDRETVYESGLSSYLVLEKLKNYIIRYYLIVMIFIIFEIEITLLYRILYSYNVILSIFYLFVIFIIIGIIIDIIYELI